MASVSDKPWEQFTAASYTTANAYCAACLIDTNQGEKSKALCKLPYKEPGGAINRAGVHAVAAVLAGGRGGVSAPQDEKVAAAKRLVSIYRNDLKEDPPESLIRLAGT